MIVDSPRTGVSSSSSTRTRPLRNCPGKKRSDEFSKRIRNLSSLRPPCGGAIEPTSLKRDMSAATTPLPPPPPPPLLLVVALLLPPPPPPCCSAGRRRNVYRLLLPLPPPSPLWNAVFLKVVAGWGEARRVVAQNLKKKTTATNKKSRPNQLGWIQESVDLMTKVGSFVRLVHSARTCNKNRREKNTLITITIIITQ